MISIAQRLTERAWSQDWPESVAADFGADCRLEDDRPGVYLDLFKQARLEIDAVCGRGVPQPLTNITRMLDRLDRWTQDHAGHLTWPPTLPAWRSAVRDSARNDRQGFILLAAAYPNAVRVALKDWPDLDNCVVASWYVKSYDTALLVKQEKEATTASPPQASASVKQEPVSVSAHPAKRQPDPAPPPAWMIHLVQQTNKSAHSRHRGLESEQIDAFIKSQISKKKGMSEDAPGYWFEDEMLPALSRLSTDQISELLAGWPPGLRFVLNNPVRVVGQGKFWGSLKAGGDAVKDVLLSDVLPALVDTSPWRSRDRYEMLEPMFELAKSEAEFKRRLDLWIAWGGDLDARMPDPSTSASDEASETAFQVKSIPMVSARDWFLSKGNQRWQQVLDDYPAPRPSRPMTP